MLLTCVCNRVSARDMTLLFADFLIVLICSSLVSPPGGYFDRSVAQLFILTAIYVVKVIDQQWYILHRSLVN